MLASHGHGDPAPYALDLLALDPDGVHRLFADLGFPHYRDQLQGPSCVCSPVPSQTHTADPPPAPPCRPRHLGRRPHPPRPCRPQGRRRPLGRPAPRHPQGRVRPQGCSGHPHRGRPLRPAVSVLTSSSSSVSPLTLPLSLARSRRPRRRRPAPGVPDPRPLVGTRCVALTAPPHSLGRVDPDPQLVSSPADERIHRLESEVHSLHSALINLREDSLNVARGGPPSSKVRPRSRPPLSFALAPPTADSPSFVPPATPERPLPDRPRLRPPAQQLVDPRALVVDALAPAQPAARRPARLEQPRPPAARQRRPARLAP